MTPVHTDAHPLRIGVLISGGGSTLQNLIKRIRDGRLRRVQICVVVSSRSDARGVELARVAGLSTVVLSPAQFRTYYAGVAAAFSEAVATALDDADAELVVMGGFLCHWAFPPRYEGRVLNIHPALLPAFGGKGMYGERVQEAVLAGGGRDAGCTVHLVDLEYDHGPIVAQARVTFDPQAETARSLGQRVRAMEQELYPEVLQQVADNGIGWLKAVARPQ